MSNTPRSSRAKATITPKAESLFAQADATKTLAHHAEDETLKSLALSAAATLTAAASMEARRDQPGAVYVLPAHASSAEVAQARRRRSVRHGQDVYLPSWRDASIGLPNLILRSALFSAIKPGVSYINQPIATQGDTVLSMTGPQLCAYDRRVFAVCLNHYKDERPLATMDGSWVQLSYWQFAKLLQVDYSSSIHSAIRESLLRLNAVTLRIKVSRVDLPIPRLLEVAFNDGFSFNDEAQAFKASDLISFRVLDSMAMLFGPADWSSVSDKALHDYSGLTAWLTSFYSTHSGPYPLKLTMIYNLSGSVCPMYEFRRRLKEALKKLQESSVPNDFRVHSFDLAKDTLIVYLARWRPELMLGFNN